MVIQVLETRLGRRVIFPHSRPPLITGLARVVGRILGRGKYVFALEARKPGIRIEPYDAHLQGSGTHPTFTSGEINPF